VSGNSFFFTEKTVRTFLLQKPFILMGSQNTLCYLRQMGFKTFHDFWDEDYDGYSDRQRYAKIIALINSLASYNVDQLFDMYQAMMPILQHNCNLILNQTFSTEVTAI
jgi:hypothetical protein